MWHWLETIAFIQFAELAAVSVVLSSDLSVVTFSFLLYELKQSFDVPIGQAISKGTIASVRVSSGPDCYGIAS